MATGKKQNYIEGHFFIFKEIIKRSANNHVYFQKMA